MRSVLPALLLALLCASTSVQAENSLRQGGYTVHYSAIPSVQVTAEVARRHAITRSNGRALVNIAIRKQVADHDQAVAGRVSGSATNEVGQRQELAFREIREAEAIYYLAEPRFREGEQLRFELRVEPEGSTQAIDVRFAQEFFSQP